MKLNLLIAALAATAVSALPVIHTNAADQALHRASCRFTTLIWTVSNIGKGDVYNNTFTYSIGYRNGWPSYATSISVDISINSGGRWVCQDDGVWCVTYSGWGKSDGVMVKYAGVELEHGGPTFRVPMEGAPRDDYFYEDCVPW